MGAGAAAPQLPGRETLQAKIFHKTHWPLCLILFLKTRKHFP